MSNREAGQVDLARGRRLRVVTIVASMMLIITPVASGPGAAAAGTASGTLEQASAAPVYVRLVAKHSGKCLTVYQAGGDNNDNVNQFTCAPGYTAGNQVLEVLSGRAILWKRLRFRHSEKCLTVYQAKTNNGANFNQFTCRDDALNQVFYTIDRGNQGSFVRVGHADDKCINVKGASRDNNANVILWTCSSTAANNLFILDWL
jgi:hypothetical protein